MTERPKSATPETLPSTTPKRRYCDKGGHWERSLAHRTLKLVRRLLRQNGHSDEEPILPPAG